MDDKEARARRLIAELLGEAAGPGSRRRRNEALAELLGLQTAGSVELVSYPDDPRFPQPDASTDTYVEVEHTGDPSSLRLRPLILVGGHVAIPWHLAALLDAKHLEALRRYFIGPAASAVLTAGSEQGGVAVLDNTSHEARRAIQVRVTFRVDAEPPQGAPDSVQWIRVLDLYPVTRSGPGTGSPPT